MKGLTTIFILSFLFTGISDAKNVFKGIKKEKNKDMTIAIIGAGASGITAAHFLKKKGYENITIYEKNNYVGGKVNTVTHKNRTYEFGAVWVPGSYSTVHELITEFKDQILLNKAPEIYTLNPESNVRTKVAKSFMEDFKITDSLKSLVATELRLLTSRDVKGVGFTSKNEKLNINFNEFLKDRPALKPVAKLLAPLISGCGYGYYSEVPALYMLKFIKMLVDSPIKGIGNPATSVVEEGYSHIWKTVASQFKDLRLNTTIASIDRKLNDYGDYEVTITTDQGEKDIFDRVIISTDLNIAKNLLGEKERKEYKLFSQVKNYPYVVSMYEATGLPAYTTDLIKENSRVETKGQSIILAKAYEDNNVYQSWRLTDWTKTDKELETQLRAEIESFGGEFKGMIMQQKWSYFPHVSTESLNNGFYEKLNALQGEKGTYYVGGIFNFETVEHTSAFAKELVKKVFK